MRSDRLLGLMVIIVIIPSEHNPPASGTTPRIEVGVRHGRLDRDVDHVLTVKVSREPIDDRARNDVSVTVLTLA